MNDPIPHRNLAADPAVLSVAAPVAFTLLVILQGLLHPDYSHLSSPISALAARPGGWIQSVNFVILAAGVLTFAATAHQRVPAGRSGIWGPALLGVSGVGLLLAAAFPWGGAEPDYVVPPLHLAGAVLTFLGAGLGLAVLSERIARDPRGRGAARYTLASGVAILVLFLVSMGLARPEDAPLHGWMGLLQRLMLLAWFPCLIYLSWRIACD